MYKKTAIVCFYEASKGGHGASEVTLSILQSIKKSKLFEIKNSLSKINNLSKMKKFFSILEIVFKIKKYFKNSYKNLIIIEGASWIGYSFFFYLLARLFLTKNKIIYHGHNIEYDLRKNNSNILVIFLTKIFERFIYRTIELSTVVSETDRRRIENLYKIKPLIFKNGVHSKRLNKKKPNFILPKRFYMFSGSYWFNPNKIAIDYLINKIYPIFQIKFPNLYLIITGGGLPKKMIKNKKILYFENLNKKNLNYLISNAQFLLMPLKKGTGTKLKTIEALMLGTQIVSTKYAMRGIEKKFQYQPKIYSNISQLVKIISSYKIKKNKKLLNKSVNYYKKQYSMELIIDEFFKKVTKNGFKFK